MQPLPIPVHSATLTTLVTVRHRGYETLRADHPARHGMADAELQRAIGMWWGELLAAWREFVATPR